MTSRKNLGLCFVLMVALFIGQVPTAVADYYPSLTAERGLSSSEPGTDFYILENDVIIENSGSEATTGVRLEVPLMADLDSPYQDIVKEEFSHRPTEIKRLDNGNRIGVFSFENLPPGTQTVLVQRYTIKVDGTNWLQNVSEQELRDPSQYLTDCAKIESGDPRIQAVALDIRQRGTIDRVDIAKRAFEFTRDTLTYNLDSPSANQGALAGLQTGTGCCEEYASLFVAVCRASGVPARIVNGYANDKDELAQDAQPMNMAGRRHQWAEFYVDGKGWIPVDPTLSNENRQVFGQLPAGCYVAENYGDNKVTGKYRGGKLAVKFQDRVARGY